LMSQHWKSLPAAARGDRVVVPYLDYISYAVGLRGSPFGSTPFAGIVMRPDFHWAEQGVAAPPSRRRLLKRWLFLRLLRQQSLLRLVTIDPSLRDWVHARRARGSDRLAYTDDPADLSGNGDRAAARASLGLPAQALVILLYGGIDMRKGVAALLALAASPHLPAEARILLVGRQSDEVRSLLAGDAQRGMPKDRVTVLDRYVDAQEEWLSFAAADFAWLAYEGFYGPSGVLAQCQQVGLPVIHRGEGLIGYHLRAEPEIAVPWLPQGLLVSRPSARAAAGGIGQLMQA